MKPDAPNGLQDLAIYDPIAALGIILHIPRVPISMNIPVSFSSFDVAQAPIQGVLDTVVCQRTWIDNVSYSLQQPNVFAGNILKPQYDKDLKAQPGVSVKIEVLCGPRYMVSSGYTPIENFVDTFTKRWPCGWVLFDRQTVETFFLLTQAPPSTSPNGPPYNVTLTFNGWQFEDGGIDKVDVIDAAERLRAMGFCIPGYPCVRE